MATLAEADLSEVERRALDRLTDSLKAELGESLRAVWLYGSRARGARREEYSDIDLLVITDENGRGEWELVSRLAVEAAENEGAYPWGVSAHVHDLLWLADRRRIKAFFIQEVDRDKIVLAGDGLEQVGRGEGGAPATGGLLEGDGIDADSRRAGLSPRSEEYLRLARDQLRGAGLALEGEVASTAISAGYMAMLNAARAALSEEDQFTRTHGGTWGLFHTTFVATGRFDPRLHSRAQESQKRREYGDYGAKLLEIEEAREILALAEEFIAAVEAMLDAA